MRLTVLSALFIGLLSSTPALSADPDELILQLPQVPNGGYQAREVPFPAVADTSTLRIRLERGPCNAVCPSYSVEISGDGSVLFYGEDLVVIGGVHRATIPKASVDRLMRALRKARFFSLLDSYVAPISDGATYKLSLSFDGYHKTVKDYEGVMIGMPAEVGTIENLIDKLTDTKRWIKGTAHSFDDLKAEGWDFRAEDDAHQKLLVSVSESGDLAFLEVLLDAGMRPRGRHGCETALRVGEGPLLDRLLGLGAPIQWRAGPGENDRSCNLLVLSAVNGDPKLLRRLLDRKPDVNLLDDEGQTALTNLAYEARRTAAHPGADVAACARLLIQAGSALEIRDRLFGATTLMMSYDAGVTRLLLEAGADPYARDKDGKTALDWAVMWRSPSVPVLKRWMAAHPQPR